MAKSSATETVIDFLKALENADLEKAEALLDDNVQYQNVPLPTDDGKAATIATLKRFGLISKKFEVIMHNIAEKDGTVLTERTDILSGPGLRLEFWVCGTFEVKNGKITLWRDYFDWATIGAQFAKSLPTFATLGLWNLLKGCFSA
jgi:limonene-1,2-epoxide hydrolase